MQVCEKCGKAMDEKNFYTYKDGRKLELCKPCLTLHIDNFNPETYLWIIEKLDIPYIPGEWNSLRDKAFAKDPRKMNGMSVIGKYISKMKLKQWKQYSWADSEILQAREAHKEILDPELAAAKDEELKRQLENGVITEAEYKTMASTAAQNEDLPMLDAIGENNLYNENNFMKESELPDPSNELTEEDKIYLAMKWGRLYKPAEWLSLEQDYCHMEQSFDIQDADTKNTLILLCKTNLKMNQAIDCGDVDGFQKLSRVYDGLRKSAKFTAAQNKDKDGEDYDAVGNLVLFCEKQGGKIERHKITEPFDIFDKGISDMKEYYTSLIHNDANISQQIENYLKRLEANEKAKQDKAAAEAQGLDYIPITDNDMLEDRQRIYNEQAEDNDLQLNGGGEEE